MTEVSQIERVAATLEIQQLQAQRCFAVDNKDWDLYVSLHAPDHVASHEGGEWSDPRSAAQQIARTLADKVTMHHLHTPIIIFETATKAKGTWAMEDHIWWQHQGEDQWFHGYGFYYETYERRDGRWVFTSRKLERLRTEMSMSPI